ncbi:hypothetical protein AB6A40_010335 [Gnathostoma spinigerum]|uniref:SAM domain-containing protein n=1 Tax=Gnathostoma spinigerum TaxID=75299 RepID=A0ABD6EW97_9BILA
MALQKMFFNQPLWLILTVVLPVFGAGSEKLTKTVLITAEDEKLRDPEGYAAIKELHRLMDDDESGSIDPEESSDFLKEDMKIGGSDRLKREKAFHHNNDNSITVDDLWEAWFGASERMWTVDEVINWLENTVKLPQYSSKFSEARVDGKTLPRYCRFAMACQNFRV